MRVLALLLLAAAPAFAMPTNSAVTQANIRSTICVPGWSKKQRPPVSYTAPIKHRLVGHRPLSADPKPLAERDFELDHHIPIELGGAPRELANLQLQPWDGPDGAWAKDRVENEVHRRVCAGRMTLAAAQTCMWKQWRTCLEPPHAHR